MSNEISFPTKPFYIMSKVNRSNQVLVAGKSFWGIGTGLFFRPLTGTVDQLWTATPGAAGGAILRHVLTGKVLTAQLATINIFGKEIVSPGGTVGMDDLDTAKPTQLWKLEDLGDNWRGINCYLQWEAKLNIDHSDFNRGVIVYHWDGGADNEEWRLVEESGDVTVDSVQYDTSKAVLDLGLPPSHCTALAVSAPDVSPVSNTYQLQRTVTTQRSITNSQSDTTGTAYTQTFGVKGGIDKVFEVSASASFQESQSNTISLTDQKTDIETVSDTISVQVSIPPEKTYSMHVVVTYGKISVPYVATSTFHSSTPGAAPVTITTAGVYTGVNSTGASIVVIDVTPAQTGGAIQSMSAGKFVEHIPLP